MKLNTYKEKLNEQWKRTGLEVKPATSVVSPLYPGNFCHCLDERDIYEKYGKFIDFGEEHYQKMQPAIRVNDFFSMGNVRGGHLGQFSIATINGFNSVPAMDGRKQYEQSVRNMFSFIDSLGLDISKLRVSYFSGNDAKSIEASRKESEQKRKIRFDRYIPEDELKHVLIEQGLEEHQLIPNNTRDNFLTSVWYVTEAPWGFRNEILYQMPNRRLLDIGTIERLPYNPIIEKEFFEDKKGYDHIATGLVDANTHLIVDGVGFERIIQAVEGKDSIFDIESYKPYDELGHSPQIIEAAKIAHRVFTDSTFGGLGNRNTNRKTTIKKVMRCLDSLDNSSLEKLLLVNAQVYSDIYPELLGGVDKTIEEIEDYRKRRK